MNGQVALVTGASKNIGRAIALKMAAEGVNVAVVANTDREGAEQVADDARARGVEALSLQADIADAEECESLVTATRDVLGEIDILIACAASRPYEDILSIAPEAWDRVLGTNLSSTFYLTRLLLPSMIDRGRGRLIAIGGPDGQMGSRHRAHNVTCKAGLTGFIKAVSMEHAQDGITANIVSPGITDTERDPREFPYWPLKPHQIQRLVPAGRLGQTSEVAEACAFLASDRADYITGQSIHVNGGMYMP